MNRSDIDRLRDARVFARYARDNAGGLSPGTLTFTIQSQHAALYDLVVIGETLNKVSSEIKSTAPDLRWRPINDLRNIIVHSYWQIDLEIIAAVIEKDLDPLVAELTRLIAFIERNEK
jgi:uncharacterized protein with HEPN domain